MTSRQASFAILILITILALELVELVAVKRYQKSEDQSFLPMVYENQIYQGV